MNTENYPVHYVSDQQRAELLYRIKNGRCTAIERYGYEWVEYLLKSKTSRCRSESSIFGQVTFLVPYEAADAVELLMAKLGVQLIRKVNLRSCKTREVVSVELTYKSKEVGVIYLPL